MTWNEINKIYGDSPAINQLMQTYGGKRNWPAGFILHEGPSDISGEPLVVIATGLWTPKRQANRKTGRMVQTYILRRDVNPMSAVMQNLDYAICGDCKYRGNHGKNRTCYVNLSHGPRIVYKAYQQQKYPPINDLWDLFDDRLIRFGTYGDPAAISIDLWKKLATRAKRWTGYTHRWKTIDPEWSKLLMASVDTPREWQQAKALGYRTFRVRSENMPLLDWEITCPASEEAGRRTTCSSCALCQGTTMQAKDIAIVAHGQGSNNFLKL